MAEKGYPEFKQLDLPAIDKTILDFWESNDVFKKSVEIRPKDKPYVFYEGPPSANGKPGIHHVMARTVKDLFCRYHTLKGKRVERKGGWDTHGLPVELQVEKTLGITKEDIGQSITVEEYNAKCRETVMQFKDMWDDLTVKMGYWVDLDNPYITFENEYIESVWYLLGQLYNKDLLYKGYSVQPYSPAAGTGLSSHELNMPGCYKDVKDTSVVSQFKLIRNEESDFLFESIDEDVRMLAWTTTPWTLPSNTALSVGPKIDYVKIKTLNPYTQAPVSVVLAEKLTSKWFGAKNQPEIIEQSASFKGNQLKDLRYEQLLDFGNEIEDLHGSTDAFRILVGNHVTTEDGTGIVHTAPSFGADDRRVAIDNGIGALTLVDKQGKFLDSVGEFSGRYVKNYKDDPDYVNTDIDIAVKLKKENNAFNVAKYSHNYPHCWRTDKPVLYYPLDSWFVKASAMKERMSELNKTINWKPAHTGTGRFGVWLENLQDWNLSRSRFWGIPLPIWRTADAEEEYCLGSIDELRQKIEEANEALGLNQVLPDDLHRPYVDSIVLVSPSGKEMKRELDLIDVWFDSGSMPYAQWHYPFENEEKFKNNYPADFIAEGVDQTRGWFYTLHAISTMVFDSVAFKNVVSNGLVLDKNGQKMSKRLGNAVDPFSTLDDHGADVVRWYMMSNANPWDNLKFDIDALGEVKRKLFGTLYNTYSFYALYANIDQFQMDEMDNTPISDRPEIDRWIISKLNSLVKDYTAAMDDYEVTKACRLVETFVMDQLSNWYVRLCRRRFWKGEMSQDKKAAYETLYQSIMVSVQLMAPIAPFISEWFYRNLTDGIREKAIENNTPLRHESVHLSLLTKVEEHHIDTDLEQRMDYAQRISSLVLSLRKKERIRVRQPLTKIMLPVLDSTFEQQVEGIKDLILSEVNIKEIEYLYDTSGVIKKKIKPNFKTLGKRLGKQMKLAAQAISQLGEEDINRIEKDGNYELTIAGETISLGLEDFEISTDDIPGWSVANDRDITVALDMTLTDSLRREGLAREIVNRVQNMRKDIGLNVTDHIHLNIGGQPVIEACLADFEQYIASETLADKIALVQGLGGDPIKIYDDLSIVFNVEKAGV